MCRPGTGSSVPTSQRPRLAGSITAIAGADLDSLVGQSAAVHLVPGQLLNRTMLSTQPALDNAHALVASR